MRFKINSAIAYKYRGGDDKVFERDLTSLEKNYFWAPNYIDLNDPCETLISTEMIEAQIENLSKIFGLKKAAIEHLSSAIENLINRRSEIGIYSLSTSFKHELLWAHYANSHKGFCIQYDLKLLVEQNMYQELHLFPVNYKKELPSISIHDVSKEHEYLFQKLFGTKSKLWKYEDELRIITDNVGENSYEYSSVTAIYFGYRMLDEHKNMIMKRLRGRSIQYYQMLLEDKSYRFKETPLEDPYQNTQPYLFQFSNENRTICYEVIEKNYTSSVDKGTIYIQLESKVSESELELIANEIKQKIFRNAKRVLMLYFLPDMSTDSGAWATTHFELDRFDIKINGFTIEQEEKILVFFSSDKRNVIGRWIDSSPFMSHGLTLYEEGNKFFIERYFLDGSMQKIEVKPSNVLEGIRYNDIKHDSNGEYFLIDSDDSLHCFSEEEEFKVLKSYLQN